jgi:hypothetical protein
MADVANHDMTLPLKGIKVLDMTRVLAGVSLVLRRELKNLTDLIAILYPNTWRSGVTYLVFARGIVC